MKISYKSLVICFQVILFALFSVNGWAVHSDNPINGTVVVSGDGNEVTLAIPPNNPYKTSELRVSPPGGGEVSIQQFYRSETPSYNPASGDGFYNYEITLHPLISPEVQEKIHAARENPSLGRVGGLPVTRVQAGGFRILNGQLVLDNMEE
jgi:hypothetical protein